MDVSIARAGARSGTDKELKEPPPDGPEERGAVGLGMVPGPELPLFKVTAAAAAAEAEAGVSWLRARCTMSMQWVWSNQGSNSRMV